MPLSCILPDLVLAVDNANTARQLPCVSVRFGKVEELDSKVKAADSALKEREDEFAKTLGEKDQVAAAEKSAKEDLEVKVRTTGDMCDARYAADARKESELTDVCHHPDADARWETRAAGPPSHSRPSPTPQKVELFLFQVLK